LSQAPPGVRDGAKSSSQAAISVNVSRAVASAWVSQGFVKQIESRLSRTRGGQRGAPRSSRHRRRDNAPYGNWSGRPRSGPVSNLAAPGRPGVENLEVELLAISITSPAHDPGTIAGRAVCCGSGQGILSLQTRKLVADCPSRGSTHSRLRQCAASPPRRTHNIYGPIRTHCGGLPCSSEGQSCCMHSERVFPR